MHHAKEKKITKKAFPIVAIKEERFFCLFNVYSKYRVVLSNYAKKNL